MVRKSTSKRSKKDKTLEKEIKGLKERIKVLEESLASEKKKSETYLNQLKYLQADFENFRKRTKKEIEVVIERGNAELVKKLLPVIDDLELAIKNARNHHDFQAFLEGVELVFKKLMDVMGKEGLEKIPTEGELFNPELHDAVLLVPSTKYGEGVVVEEVRSGFKFKNRLIRPALVKVSKGDKG